MDFEKPITAQESAGVLKMAAGALEAADQISNSTGGHPIGATAAAGTKAIFLPLAKALRTEAKAATQLGARGFESFRAFKREIGPAGPGMDWHHVVEQSKAAQFGSRAINNTDNMVALPQGVHRQISAYYSSKQEFTNGQTVRQWLNGQSFEQQSGFGQQVIDMYTIPKAP